MKCKNLLYMNRINACPSKVCATRSPTKVGHFFGQSDVPATSRATEVGNFFVCYFSSSSSSLGTMWGNFLC
jgi:hypothetical protein